MVKLLAFLHLAVKQRALQAELEAALSSLTVTAIGRVADFERELARGHDAVLTLSPVLTAHQLTPILSGYFAGQPNEPYVLLAADTAPDPAKARSVGALDLFGREGTTSFVHSLLGSKPKVERVTKLEDLLPLLQIQRVDAVLLPVRLVSDLRSSTQMKLSTRQLSQRVGLPAVALLSPQGTQAATAVAALPRSFSERLGVDEWR